jgi:Tol biopolymer transport system component
MAVSWAFGAALLALVSCGLYGLVAAEEEVPTAPESKDLLVELKACNHKIVYETYRDNNWELFMVNADGSNPVNLTRTPTVNELYPHVSPDGSKVSFVADEGKGAGKIRNVYYMNIDGTGRTLVAKNAREPCWNVHGTAIVYPKGELDEFSYLDYATKGIFIYELKTRQHKEHANKGIHHLYNICWSPDDRWFLATVHGGMGFKHGILAIPANGTKVYDLKIPGCRPDISPDGKKVAWGASDWSLCTADLDFSGPQPRVRNTHIVVGSANPIKIYHVDWSPDGRYVTFSRGPEKHKSLTDLAPEMVGVHAPGWNICVADVTKRNRWVQITSDGKSNKEPDWAPVPAGGTGR